MKTLVIAVALVHVPMRADAKGCHERSAVVGLQHCSHFGTWSRDDDTPRLWFDLGYTHHSYRSQPFTLGTGVAAAMLADSVSTVSHSAVLRGLEAIGHTFYVGFELAFGDVSVQIPLNPPPTYATAFAPNLVAGAHVDYARIGFSAELAGGGRFEEFDYCPVKGCMVVSVGQSRRVLEARVGADLFLYRNWSVGLRFGKSLIDEQDTSFMLTTGIHTRAMDGM